MAGHIYHSFNGTVLTITSDSGSSSCDLKGATGDTGIRGPQGPKGEKGNGIDSVNGKIGDVVLTYEDVGALPDTYVPPVTKVNSKTGEVTLTYEDVGALPNNYVAPVTSVNTKTGAVQLTYSDINAAAANHTHTASDVGALAAGGTAADSSKLGGKSASDYALKTDTAPDSSKLGGKAPEYYIQPRNLLDNSDFRNPVNQRGIISGASIPAYSYFIDRWINQTNEARSFTLSTSGIGLSLVTTLLQRIEKIEAGKIVTFAIKLSDGTIATLTGTVQYTSDDSWTRFASKTYSFGDMYMETMNGFVNVVVYNTEAITIEWAALYEGSYTAETLPPYVPKGYAAELAECQRYYCQSFSGSNVIEWNGAIVREAMSASRIADVSFPQTMRIEKPTITLYSPVSGGVNKISEYLSDTDVDAKAGYRSRYRFMLVSNASAFEIGKHYAMHYTVSADL